MRQATRNAAKDAGFDGEGTQNADLCGRLSDHPGSWLIASKLNEIETAVKKKVDLAITRLVFSALGGSTITWTLTGATQRFWLNSHRLRPMQDHRQPYRRFGVAERRWAASWGSEFSSDPVTDARNSGSGAVKALLTESIASRAGARQSARRVLLRPRLIITKEEAIASLNSGGDDSRQPAGAALRRARRAYGQDTTRPPKQTKPKKYVVVESSGDHGWQ